MAQDVSKEKNIAINLDDDGPEEGEIQDDSSEEELSCSLNSRGDFFKGKSNSNAKDVFFSEGKTKSTITVVEDLPARIGYPACVEEVYSGRQWVEKADLLDSQSLQARKAANGADYQVEKENKAKYHGHSKSSRRLRSSGSPSTTTSKSKIHTRSETLRSSVISRRKSRAQTKEKHKKRKNNPDENRSNSKISVTSNLLGKKLGLHTESTDIEVQIQKTKRRFQNKECKTPNASLPEKVLITPETITLSSSDNQDLNKSSSSVEILDAIPTPNQHVIPTLNQPEISQTTAATNEISVSTKIANVGHSETLVDDNKEELNLRLIALKSAIQAKYGGKGKALKNKQNHVQKDVVLEQHKCGQKNEAQLKVDDIDVEPVDMDLSITDDEKEEEENNFGSGIPVIVNSFSIDQTSDLMFYQNWHEPSAEIPANPLISNEYIVIDQVLGSPPRQKFEEITNSYPSSILIQNLVPINTEHISTVNMQNLTLPFTEQVAPTSEKEIAKKRSEVEEEDEELLRAQLLIAISKKQNSVPASTTADPPNVPPLETNLKPSTQSPKKMLLNQVNASKAGSKLILKEIFKSKKAQKLRKARSFKAPSKVVAVKSTLMATRTLAAKKVVSKTAAAVKSSDVTPSTQPTPSVGRFVINLGEDSDSEEESDTSKKIETLEKIVEKPPESMQSKLALNLDQFLKQVRQDVEQKQLKPESELLQLKQIEEGSSKDVESDINLCATENSVFKSPEHKDVSLSSSTSGSPLASVKKAPVNSTMPSKISSQATLQLKKSSKSHVLDLSEAAIKNTTVGKITIQLNGMDDTPPKASKKATIKVPVTASTKDVLSTKKITPKTIPLKAAGQCKVLTPSAVSHLPSSQQMEYRRLKLEIARREELRKLKLKLDQAASRSPSEINVQDPPKLEITVNNCSSVEDDACGSRVVRRTVFSETMSDPSNSNEDLPINFEVINKEGELIEDQELKISTSENCDKKSTEKDQEVPCKDEDYAKDMAMSNDNSNNVLVLNVPQPNADSKVSEIAVHKKSEGNIPGSFKRKSLGLESTSKRVKVNAESSAQGSEEERPVFVLTNNTYIEQPAFKCQNLNQLPALSISLSEKGRSVEELAPKTLGASCESSLLEPSTQSLVNESETENNSKDHKVNAIKKNRTLKKISKERNNKIKVSKTRNHQNRKSNISKEEGKKALAKSEFELLKNRTVLLEQLKRLENLLSTVKHRQDQVTDAEARVEALKRELNRAEIRAEEERSAVRKLFNQVGQVRVEVAQARTQCAGISKTCQSLGHEVMGKSYRAPQDGTDELKIHLQQVVELTQKTRKSKQISRPSTPLPNSNPSTPSIINLDEISINQDPDINLSATSNASSNSSQTEHSNTNNYAENCCDSKLANKNLEKMSFCIDFQPFEFIDKNKSKVDIPVPCNSNPVLCKTAVSCNLGAGSLLKPYKSPLEHMKLRDGVHEEGDTVGETMDPNKVMCPYELTGRCNDDGCKYVHPCSSK